MNTKLQAQTEEYKFSTKAQLEEILKKHKAWLNGEIGGERADLRSANLRDADLRFTNLQYANLRDADLRDADLRFTNLQYANLRDADLRSANLQSANLRSANLQSANLQYANLRSANLQSANLRSANLRSANLQSANLQCADLQSADLLIFQHNRATAYFTFDGHIIIGCQNLTVKDWVKRYKAIGKEEGYTKDEINSYGIFIKLCAQLSKKKVKK